MKMAPATSSSIILFFFFCSESKKKKKKKGKKGGGNLALSSTRINLWLTIDQPPPEMCRERGGGRERRKG